MRKLWIGAAALALCVGAGSVLAAGLGQTGGGQGKNYVDANGDGVCDPSDGGSTPVGSGANYVDADGDGVCDRYDGGCARNGGGHHGHQGHRGGRNG